MGNKKKRTIGILSIFFIVALVFVISKSFGYEIITSNDVTPTGTNPASAISDESQGSEDFALFHVRRLNPAKIIGVNVNVTVNKTYSTVNPNNLKAKVEIGRNNTTFTEDSLTTAIVPNSTTSIYSTTDISGVNDYNSMYIKVTLYDGDAQLNLHKRNIDCTIDVKSSEQYSSFVGYSGNYHEFTATVNGKHTIELWGAAGNYEPANMRDQVGAGAYVKGSIDLNVGDKLYIYVGQNAKGQDTTNDSFCGASFNAGSISGCSAAPNGTRIDSCSPDANCHNSSSGGGATDVRIIGGAWDDATSLASRIMVAGGGGGTQRYGRGAVVGKGGDAGGLVGYYAGLTGTYFSSPWRGLTIKESDGINTVLTSNWRNELHDFTFGGTQKQGGMINSGGRTHSQPGTFGKGGDGDNVANSKAGGGGGGGWYGGGGGGLTPNRNGGTACHSPGGGGSSFISGFTGSISYNNQSNPNCTEQGYRPENYVGTTNTECSIATVNGKSYVFTETVMIDGRGCRWENGRRIDELQADGKCTGRVPDPDGTGERYYIDHGNFSEGAARITYASETTAASSYQWTKQSAMNITVHYVDTLGAHLAEDHHATYGPETPYDLPPLNIEHYHVVRYYSTPSGYGIPTGTTADEDFEITYVYDKNSYVVETYYIDRESNEHLAQMVETTYKYGETYTTQMKNFPLYNFVNNNTRDPASGTVDGNKVVVYLYTRKVGTLRVRYLEKGTDEVLAPEYVNNSMLYGNNYSTTPLDIKYFNYDSADGETSGTFSGDVTITYYYVRKIGKILVNHVDCETNVQLAPQDVINNQKYGERYTTASKTIPEYQLDAVPENAAGVYEGPNPMNVTYSYCKKPAVVIANYLEQGTNNVLALRYEHGVEFGDNYETYPVEIKYFKYVNRDGDPETGTVNKERTVVNYYYTRKDATLTVRHLDVDNNNELYPTETSTVKYGLNYTTSSKDIENYEFIRVEGEPFGVVEGDTEVIYYYKRLEGRVIARHLEEGTDRVICDPVDTKYLYGEEYQTTKCLDHRYEFVRVVGEETGIVKSSLITVTYYYRLKDATLTVRHLDIDDLSELYPDEVRNVHWDDDYTTSQREFTGYEFKKVEGEPSGKVNADNLVITYFYGRKEFKLMVYHLEEFTDRELANKEERTVRYNEEYHTSQKVIENYRLKETPLNADGIIKGNTTVIYYYNKKSAELVVKYLEEGTNYPLSLDYLESHNFGDEYRTTRRDFYGYEYSRVVGNEDGIIAQERTVVTYYYKILRGRLTVKYLDIDTNAALANTIQKTDDYGSHYHTDQKEILGYDFVNVDGEEEGVIYLPETYVTYYYRKTPLTLTVHYKEEETNRTISPDLVLDKKYGDSYSTNKIDIPNYLYTRVVGQERGTMTSDVEVTYYYKQKPARIIVKYLDKETSRPLAPEDTIDTHFGDNYDTIAKEIDDYKVVESPSNASGVVDAEEITVIYYYGVRDAEVITKYLEDGTNREIAYQERRGYNYGDNYTTFQKSIYSYEFVRSEGETFGIVNQEQILVMYYYRKTTKTLTVRYLELDSEKELAPSETETMDYGSEYHTNRKDIPYFEFYRVIGNESGRLESDTRVTYYYVRKTGKLIVKHLELGTNTELRNTVTTDVRYGDNYETHQEEIRNYEFNSVSGIPTGIIENDITKVTYYYNKRPSKIIAYYVDVKTNEEIATREEQIVVHGDYYTTKSSGGVPKNYEFIRKTPNYEGVALDEEIKVYYYYQKVDSNLSTTIDKYGTKEITSVNDPVSYYIEYTAKVSDYIGNGKITIVDKLPYEIDTVLSDLDDGVYNKSKKTITWEIKWDNINTYENRNEITIEKNIRVKYVNIPAIERVMNNNVSGTIVLDNNKREVEADVTTKIKVPGKVTVHHYIEKSTTKLFKDDVAEGLVGETYISHEKTKEGYEVARRPINETVTFGEYPIEMIYEYRKIKFNITTEVVGGIGTITGDEEVPYGEDSTPDNIVITPGEGYEIEKITINGEEYEITDPDGMTLPNFTNVREHIKVEVSFTEKAIPVPITGRVSKIIIAAMIVIIICIVSYITVSYRKKKITSQR